MFLRVTLMYNPDPVRTSFYPIQPSPSKTPGHCQTKTYFLSMALTLAKTLLAPELGLRSFSGSTGRNSERPGLDSERTDAGDESLFSSSDVVSTVGLAGDAGRLKGETGRTGEDSRFSSRLCFSGDEDLDLIGEPG